MRREGEIKRGEDGGERRGFSRGASLATACY